MTLATRRLWLAVASAAALALALLAAYSAALARLPQQRAAIESFLREQTGFELRFERLAVQLGLYGPEAHFGDVTLWRAGSERQLLQAPELVVRFETWRLLRSGTLRPGRILVVGAEIDADALRELEASGRRGPSPAVALTPEQRLLRRLVDLARGLPPGRIELEAATLRGFERDADGAATGRLVSLPRLAFERSPGSVRVHGGALLGGRLGRSINMALELRGLDAGPQALEGAVLLQGRELRAEGWRAALGLPREGWRATADLRLVLRLRAGTVQGGTVTASGRELQLPLGATTRGAARYAQFSGELGFEREPEGDWSLRGSDLRLAGAGLPARRVAWSGSLDAAWRVLRVETASLPLEWLQPLLAWPALASLDGDLDALQLELRFDTGAISTRYAARAADLRWQGPQGDSVLEPLALRLEGDARVAQLVLEPTDTQLTLRATTAADGDDPERYAIALTGDIELRREAAGWRAAIRSLQLAQRREQQLQPRLDVAGALTVPREGDSSLEVGVTLLQALDARELPALDRLAVAAASVAVRDVALAGGRFTLRAAAGADGAWRLSGSSGELAVSRVDVTPGAGWPAVAGAGGRLRWDEPQLRFEFERGEIAGLRLLRGSLERGARPRWSLSLEGPVQAAVRALAATPLAPQLPPELTAIGLLGPARFELQVEAAAPATVAAGAPVPRAPAAPRWSLQARLQGVRWQLLQHAAPIEALSGIVGIVDGAVQPSQLDGRWMGQPVSLVAQRRRTGVRWLLSGRWPTDTVAELLPGYVDGRAQLGWRIEASPVRGDPARWRVEAALEDAAARALFELAANPARGFQLQRGVVRFGAGPLILPEAAELQFAGTLPELELTQLAQRWAALRPLLAGGPPVNGVLELRALALAGEPLGPVRASFAATAAGAGLVLDGERIDGRLQAAASDSQDPPRIELARLSLARLPGRAALRATASAAPWSTSIVVDQLRVGARLLGAVRARLVSDDERLALRELRFAAGDWLASGALDCRRAALRCDARLELAGGSARSALDLWGIGGDFDATSFVGSATLGWPIADSEQAWAALDGELQLTAVDGSLGAPARVGLLGESRAAWPWRELALAGRFRGPRLEILQLALEGEQRLLLRGELGLRDAELRLEGEWWPQRELPQALADWPAAPTLAALARALRGRDIVPRPVQVVGSLAALELQLPPLQSPPAP
jgi:hypothetical protein